MLVYHISAYTSTYGQDSYTLDLDGVTCWLMADLGFGSVSVCVSVLTGIELCICFMQRH